MKAESQDRAAKAHGPKSREFGAGEVLAQRVCRQWLEKCGRAVRVFRGCRLVLPERITLGDFSQIDEGVCIFGGTGVTIGRHVHFALGSSITGGGGCVVGDHVGIGAGVRLVTGTDLADGSGLTNPTVPGDRRAVARGEVVIGAHAILYTGSIVLPGVRIGEGAVVAAGAVVHHDLKSWCVYAGNPLVQVGTRPRRRVLGLARELEASEAGEDRSARGRR